jgi:hypothetical protein
MEWPQIHDLPASITQVLGLQACAATPISLRNLTRLFSVS